MKTEIMEVCNQEMKKKEGKNKGFSLVELIVVIAIMAILAIVIAPQVMKYIGKSKDSVDASNMALYKTATTTTLADESIYSTIAALSSNYVITIEKDGTTGKAKATYSPDTVNAFETEFEDVLNDGLKLPQQPGKTSFKITVNVDTTDKKIGKIEVTSLP